jgi:hypothetical protein
MESDIMVETIYSEIITLLLLVYIIDKKRLPQIIIMFLAISMLIHELTIATDIKSQIGTFILFAIVIVYSSLQIVLEGKDEV